MGLRNARFFIGTVLMLGCAWAHGMDNGFGPAPGGGGGGVPAVAPDEAKAKPVQPLDKAIEVNFDGQKLPEVLKKLETLSGLKVEWQIKDADWKETAVFTKFKKGVTARVLLDWLGKITGKLKWTQDKDQVVLSAENAEESFLELRAPGTYPRNTVSVPVGKGISERMGADGKVRTKSKPKK